MQYERRRDGERYVVGAYGQNQRSLEALRGSWPGALAPQWAADGVVVRTPDGARQTPPCWVVWRPATADPPLPIAVDEAVAGEAPAPPATAAPRRPGPRALPRTAKHKNLTRIEAGEKNRPGYLVRVRWQQQSRGKFFADAAHGDRLGALAAALAWRDQVEQELGKPRTSVNVVGAAASNTGLVGITRTSKDGHPVFQVTWYEDGRQRRRVFNIDRLGERRALAAAKKLRADTARARLR
jgi:hypothetical protein